MTVKGKTNLPTKGKTKPKEAAKKAAMEAPDKEKLNTYAGELHACMKPYQFATESAAEKCNQAAQKILEAIKILQS